MCVYETDDVISFSDASLSLSVALIRNHAELIGIFHALLPWEMLFHGVNSLKSGRGHSHFFIMNTKGHILYHPLLPSNFQSDVSVASIESEDVLTQLQMRLAELFVVIHSVVIVCVAKTPYVLTCQVETFAYTCSGDLNSTS